MKLDLPDQSQEEQNIELSIAGEPICNIPLVSSHMKISLMYEESEEQFKGDRAATFHDVLTKIQRWFAQDFGAEITEIQAFHLYEVIGQQFTALKKSLVGESRSLTDTET